MYHNKPRRFRRRVNDRGHSLYDNGGMQARQRSNLFSNSQTRNHFRTPQSVEKLFEKYNNLAKEALTSGDKTLSENYFQHADHFMRIIEDKNKNKTQDAGRPVTSNKNLDESSDINQATTTEEKKE